MTLFRLRISEAVSQQRAVSFVLYWGAGLRNCISSSDVQCLDFLKSMFERICAVYSKGVSAKLIFTDTHAQLNGIPAETSSAYFSAIEQWAKRLGYGSVYMSKLLKPNNLANSVCVRAYESIFPEENRLMEELTKSAGRHFYGQGDVRCGARTYLDQNRRERMAVQDAFPDSIFLTFNGSTLRSLFPENMPIFYMYSLRKGFSEKPWFIGDAERVSKKVYLQGMAPT